MERQIAERMRCSRMLGIASMTFGVLSVIIELSPATISFFGILSVSIVHAVTPSINLAMSLIGIAFGVAAMRVKDRGKLATFTAITGILISSGVPTIMLLFIVAVLMGQIGYFG